MSNNRWCFTLNNPENNEVPLSWSEHLVYAEWQREVGEQGTPHLQGYFVLKKKVRMSWLKRNLNEHAHWEPMRGNLDQNRTYCTKPETRVEGPWEFGARPGSGRGARTDLMSLKRALDEGRNEREIAEDDSLFAVWTRAYKAAERYKRLKTSTNRSWITYTTVFYGPPGTGKTRRAQEEAGPEAYWVKRPGPGQTAFFDGYDGQENVVIDEFFGWLPRDLMCRLCDRYPCMVDTKGGSTKWYPKRIWITSNAHPFEWWSKIGLGAMQRRLTGELGEVFYMPTTEVRLRCGDDLQPSSEIPPLASAPEGTRVRVYDSDAGSSENDENVGVLLNISTPPRPRPQPRPIASASSLRFPVRIPADSNDGVEEAVYFDVDGNQLPSGFCPTPREAERDA